jgi:hypothetical protein
MRNLSYASFGISTANIPNIYYKHSECLSDKNGSIIDVHYLVVVKIFFGHFRLKEF